MEVDAESARIITIDAMAHRVLIQDGIVHIHVKPEDVTIDAMNDLIAKCKQIPDEKFYAIIDPTEERSFNEKARKIALQWMGTRMHAAAIIARKKSRKVIFDLIAPLIKGSCELKAFTNVEEARTFLLNKRSTDQK